MNLDDVSQDSSSSADPSGDCDTPHCDIGEWMHSMDKSHAEVSYENTLLHNRGLY